MKCPKCGTTYNHDRDYCINCGEVLNKEIVETLGDTDNEYLYYYFDEFKNGKDLKKINVGFIFLPVPMFLFYRLYYECAIFICLILICIFSLTVVLALTGPFGFFIALFATLAPIFYYLYYIFHVNKKRKFYAVNKIAKIRIENKDKTTDEIGKIIESNSKNNTVAFVVALIIQVLLLLFIILMK